MLVESGVLCLDGQRVLKAMGKDSVNIPLGMQKGLPFPKGASLAASADTAVHSPVVNFAVQSQNAASVTLCLLDKSSHLTEVELLPEINKTGDVWHVALEMGPDLVDVLYGWKADGTSGWEGGSRFHPELLLLDPYSKAVESVRRPGSNLGEVFLGSLTDLSAERFDWQRAPRPRYGFEQLIVSELDLTSLPEAGPVSAAALEMTEKMADAGVNAVLLRGAMLSLPDAKGKALAPLSYFAPNLTLFQTAHELKILIRECHKRAMEVFLEVQFCFTAEEEQLMSLKGLDVHLYFRGNGVLNCGHPVVQQLVLDVLHHWMEVYKVDGFVFFNAESMGQDRDGSIQDSPSLPEAIAADPLLKACKLVAVSGDDRLLPRQGERGFPHWGIWTQYNSRFQFDFWDFLVMTAPGKLSNIATRITGSADLFAACWDGGFPGSLAAGRRPGFGFNSPVALFKGLNNSVKTDQPQVQTLGGGVGPSYTPALVRSLLVAAVISQGVPVSPMDCWEDDSLAQFFEVLLQFRRTYLDLIQPSSFDAIRALQWHGAVAGHQPDWEGGQQSHFLGYSITDGTHRGFYVGFNAAQADLEVQAPDAIPGATWRVVIYTGLPEGGKEVVVSPHSPFQMGPKTAVIMELVPPPEPPAAV